MAVKILPHTLMVQRQLLQYLADGQVVSGSYLAEQLGISRAAIAKHIDLLQALGLDIYAIRAKGYQLAQPITLLDAAQIRRQQAPAMAEIWLQHITDSTNTQLLKRLQDGQPLSKGQVIVAEAQTAGRGRRGNTWVSPYGSNLYFSLYWPLSQGIQAAMGLSLVIGVAVAELLEHQFGVEVALKWPNDIYIQGQKLGGILVELAGQSHAQCDVVIGLGLNIALPERLTTDIQQAVTSLQHHVEAPIDRNQLIPALQLAMVQALTAFELQGFRGYMTAFNQRDMYRDQAVSIKGGQALSGICRGVDATGCLVLEVDGQRQSIFAGEVSLRPKESS